LKTIEVDDSVGHVSQAQPLLALWQVEPSGDIPFGGLLAFDTVLRVVWHGQACG